MPENQNPQRHKWTQKKQFDSFEDADKFRNSLKEEGHLTKVRRCGPAGGLFKVVIGSEIQKNNKNKAKK